MGGYWNADADVSGMLVPYLRAELELQEYGRAHFVNASPWWRKQTPFLLMLDKDSYG